MTSPKISQRQFIALAEPWSLLDGSEVGEEGGGPLRAGLGPLLAARFTENERAPDARPQLAGRLEGLPCHGPPAGLGPGAPLWRTYDLPAAERHEEEPVRIRFAGGGEVMLRVRGQIPRTAGAGKGSSSTETSEALEALVDSLVGGMLELRAQAERFAGRGGEACDQGLGHIPSEPEAFERGIRLALARLPWERVGCVLEAHSSEPRMDVIVEIALKYRDTVASLARSPRRILQRQRRLISLGRVEQLDHACLEWFVRRPGHTAAEKAGVTQELLALARTEDYDTLENRVLKDFLRRCVDAANLYLREHQGRFEQSTRCRAVLALRDTCWRLLRESPLLEVRSLPGFPQPNYVLLHDPAYRELWQWYLKLVRRREVTDSAWRWQRRLWEDFVRLCVAREIITADVPRNGFRARLPFAHDLWIRQEQDAGCWLHPLDWPGPIWLELDHSWVIAQLVHPLALSHGGQYAGLPVASWMGLTGASLAVVFFREGTPQVCLFFWAIHSAAERAGDPPLGTQAERAARALAWLAALWPAPGVTFHGIIVRSCLAGPMATLAHYRHPGPAEVLDVCAPAEPAAWQGAKEAADFRSVLYHCATLAAHGGR